jgi:hypothetical protein
LITLSSVLPPLLLATFTNLTVSTGSTIDFTGATVSNGGTFTTVTISGGTITGITDLAIADGGTGASTASAARTNLGVAIGTNVQAYDAGLQSISGLTTTADQMIYTTSSDTYATASLTSAGRALLDDADASAQRTTLGLGTLATQNANSVAITGGAIAGVTINASVIGGTTPAAATFTTLNATGGGSLTANVVRPRHRDDDWTSTVGNTKAERSIDPLAQWTFHGHRTRGGIDSSGRFRLARHRVQTLLTVAGTRHLSVVRSDASGGGALTGTWSDLGTVTTVDINGGTITGITDLAVADGGTGSSTAAGARTNLGVAIGSNVQAYDAGLNSIAGLVTAADRMIYTTASDTYAVATLTAAGRAILDDADAAAQRTTLGLGTIATQAASAVAITGGTADNVVIGGTTAAAGTFTTLNATGGGSLTGTWSDLGTVTTIDINGGTIDGVVIGSSAAAAATVTTLSAGGAAVYPGVITAIGAAGEVVAGNTTGSLATFSNAGAAAISLHGAAANSATVYFGTTGAGGNTVGAVGL